jgi:hypothetical protein
MKRPAFAFCLVVAVLLPALVIIFRPVGESSVAIKPAAFTAAKAISPAKSASTPAQTPLLAKSPGAAAKAAEEQAKTIQHFLQTMGAWETASGLEGDRLEEQLRNLISDENAEAILRALPPRFHGTYVGNLLLARWAAQDRGGAIHWLAGQNSPTLFEVNAVTKDWVVQDPAGLEGYLNALPASTWKSLLLESTGRDALTNNDPEQAFHLLQSMNDSPAKLPLLANAVQQWAQWDPRSAVEEIDKLPDPAARERLILAVASGYALAAPEAAADWLSQSFRDGPTLDRGLTGVMQAWVSTGNPVMAAQWVTKLPEGSTRDHALKELIAAWTSENPETFKNWMSALPDGPTRGQVSAVLSSPAATP